MSLINLFVTLLLIGVAVAEPQWYNSADGRKYLIEGQAKYNWFRASNECSRRNMQLVEIQSETKNQALVQLLKSIFGTSTALWLGGNDQFNNAIDTKRPFYWSSSGKSIAYSNWYQGEPNNERNQEHCVQTFAYSPNFQWNDVSCINQYGFICEEEQSRSDYLQALEERRQHVLNAMKKINELMQREQEKVQEMVQSVRSLIAKSKNDVEKYVEAISNRSSHDSQENEVTPVSSDTNDQISELNERLQALTSRISNKLSEKLEEVQQTIEQVVKNNSL